MGFFSTTEKLVHTYPLPPKTTLSSALKAIQNHDWLLNLDPEMESYTLKPPVPSSSPSSAKSYDVINNMPQIPKYIHEATVNIAVEITDVQDGINLLVHPPLGILQKGQWRIVGEEGALKLVIETEITCSRVLMGIAKGKAEGNHPLIGDSLTDILNRDLEAEITVA